jgi:hypothetical protein
MHIFEAETCRYGAANVEDFAEKKIMLSEHIIVYCIRKIRSVCDLLRFM